MVQHVVKDSPAGRIGLKGGYLKVTIGEDEILLGGDIILQIDELKITGEESYMKLGAYLNDVNSTVTHTLKVLRSGEIIELRWVSKDFRPEVK